MAGYQMVWAADDAPEYCGVSGVSFADPSVYSSYIQASWFTRTRKFLLQRAVFDLVATYQVLERDDKRLLAWYLHLSSQDRQIILDEGGFQQFLQRHPALELCPRYVSLKQMVATEQDVRRLPVSAPIVGSLRCRMASPNFPGAHDRVVRVIPHQISAIQDVSHSGLCTHLYSLAATPLDTCMQSGFSTKRSTELDPEYQSFNAVKLEIEKLVEFEEPEDAKSNSVPLSLSTEDTPTKVNPNDLAKPRELAVQDENGNSGTERSHTNTVDHQSVGCSLAWQSCAQSTGQGRSCVGVSVSDMQKAAPEMSPHSSVSSCDPLIRAKHVQFVSVSTQTHAPTAADKNVVTDVHMRDLDWIMKEFTRLYAAAQARCKQEKNWKKLDQRVRHAELYVLTLQYSMCRQHCWRLFNMSSEGPSLYMLHGAPSQCWPQDTPPKVVSVLRKLDCDYREMRDQIMAGVPLKDLKALSVDAKMVTGTSYIPLPTYQVKMVGEFLASAQPSDDQVPGSTMAEKKAATSKTSNTSGSGAALNMSPGHVCSSFAAKHKIPKQWNDGASDEEEPPASITLCVSNLPLTVTERDAFAMFENYSVVDVKISSFNNSSRVATVKVRGSHSALKAVAALNGCTVQGHVLHVEEAKRGSRGQVLPLSAPSSGPGCIDRKVTVQPPQRNIATHPAAKDGFLPTHLGSMESMDILMAEMKQRHPGVGWERILDAFAELHGKHRLLGISLKTVSQMMSELLTSPANVTP
ncbi:RNA-binding protein 44 isoform X3 [Synchiropus splendidus]|uniref:RNA-binding protein 44 isoform X3 n=1 Tax=Synchiropus splendidus TaxID=270530 RepID=UPI00237DD999|nr:RNA-binding protein 44 isoform X3 [Synchiropus splendidus]